MTKPFFPSRWPILCAAFVFLAGASSLAGADDRFALAIGAHDKLVVFGPKGVRVAELSVPAVGQLVTVGGVSFQVSYGRDSRGQLTAILTPASPGQAELNFTVLGKSIAADQAVVTLVFSSNLANVAIHAGYGGKVEVNSRRISPSMPTP